MRTIYDCMSYLTPIHTGSIYATPSLILHNSGSVGVALLMWLAGASIAALGTVVYIELGTVCLIQISGDRIDFTLVVCPPQGLPRSGGEKNYLEYIYRRPKFLVSCVYVSYALLTVGYCGSRFCCWILTGLPRALQQATAWCLENVCYDHSFFSSPNPQSVLRRYTLS
jgi:hypothetical protein